MSDTEPYARLDDQHLVWQIPDELGREVARRWRRLNDEIERLKSAVQTHYDQRGDDRCHLDDLKLYHDALGINPDPYVTALPPDADMAESCRRYVAQRQVPEVHGTYLMPGCMTIRQLTDEVARLTAERDAAILRQVMYAGDGSGRDAWTIEGANSSGWAEKRGPYRRQEAAIAAVLAWVRYEVDPDAPPGPIDDGEGDDE